MEESSAMDPMTGTKTFRNRLKPIVMMPHVHQRPLTKPLKSLNLRLQKYKISKRNMRIKPSVRMPYDTDNNMVGLLLVYVTNLLMYESDRSV